MSCRAEDNDADGMDDCWEIANSLDPEENDAPLDPDKDNLTNIYEFLSGTDPNEKDTDRDGLDDGYEVNIAKTNPKNIDTAWTCVHVATYSHRLMILPYVIGKQLHEIILQFSNTLTKSWIAIQMTRYGFLYPTHNDDNFWNYSLALGGL